MREIGGRGGEGFRENKIVIVEQVMRGGSTRIEKDRTRPRGCIAEVSEFSEGERIKAWGQRLEQGCMGSYSG